MVLPWMVPARGTDTSRITYEVAQKLEAVQDRSLTKAPYESWSLDFVADELFDGQKLLKIAFALDQDPMCRPTN